MGMQCVDAVLPCVATEILLRQCLGEQFDVWRPASDVDGDDDVIRHTGDVRRTRRYGGVGTPALLLPYLRDDADAGGLTFRLCVFLPLRPERGPVRRRRCVARG